MKLNFLVAPDFAPERFAGWHMLNSLLQSRTGLHMHLMTPATAHWLMDHARWAIPVILVLVVAGWIEWVCTEGRGLWKHGPRYWRVQRKLRRREHRRETR